jgi:ApbE superfamily uncharacterized protein (UPF0280 family)
MKTRAQISLLPDGRRLHLQDGPIDIVLEGFGDATQIQTAYRAAADRFVTVLDELCTELPLLRAQARGDGQQPQGVIARRMFRAVAPYAEHQFITPMAAVAGSVAEEILFAMTASARLDRAYVNDGGDIALHVGPKQSFTIAMVERPVQPSLLGTVLLDHSQPSRGIATSGWLGRSFSLGIADSVTVIASRAAMADAAATVIANSVDIPGHPAITRVHARELVPDSDIGHLLVTTAVGGLTSAEADLALSRGVACADLLRSRGLISAAALSLRERNCLVTSSDERREIVLAEHGSLIHA